MAGTKAGGLKAAAKNLAKDPNFYKRIGAIGGKKGTTGGFYANRELARIAGAKGGRISRRTLNVLQYTINKPVWNTESVGIAARRLVVGTTMEITIDYKDASGQLVYPYKYRMACSKMKRYPTQSVKGTVLHIIPIADFEAATAGGFVWERA